MTTTYFQPRPLRFTGAFNAFTGLFLLLSTLNINFLTPVSAFAPHNLQPFVRFAPIANLDRTVVGMVSTLANGGYDDLIMEAASDHHPAMSQHRRTFPFRTVPNQNSILTDHELSHHLPREVVISTTSDLQFLLPRRSTVVAHQNVPTTAMEQAERILSRVSMVAALVLIVNELATGQSLPDQIGSVATMLIV